MHRNLTHNRTDRIGGPAKASSLILLAAGMAGALLTSNTNAQPFRFAKCQSEEAFWSSTDTGDGHFAGALGGGYFSVYEAPVGKFKLDYKHWFSSDEPPAWSTHDDPDKPALEDWNDAADIEDDNETWGDVGWATSEWTINPHVSWLWDSYHVKAKTVAKAEAHLDEAHSKASIEDPWEFRSPATEPTWDHVNFPLDPDGKWVVGGQVCLFGEQYTPDALLGLQDARTELSYSIALNSRLKQDAVQFLRVRVTPMGSDVSLTPPDGVGGALYRGDFSYHEPVTEEELEAMLDSYLVSTGWKLAPSFSLDDFDPRDEQHLADVFNLFFFLDLDDRHTEAILFTSHVSSATDIAAAPGLTLSVISSCPGSGPATFTASGASGGSVAFVYTLNGAGSFVVPNGVCAGTQLGLAAPVAVGGIASGNPAVLSVNVPSAACGRVTLQAIDLDTCATSNIESF